MKTLARHITVALVGNPNTGKTTLFNALSGMRQRVGNYPGVTVETKKGQLTYNGQVFDLVDLPGTYSLAPRSPDEMVAVDLILGHQAGEPRPDVVVSIVDASNLERNLYLTTQALELGVPVVVALNMIDVAEGQGTRIDADQLSQQLGVPVVPIQANKSKGLDRLKQAIAEAAGQPPPAKTPEFPSAFEQEVSTLQQSLGNGMEPYLVRRLLLDVGGHTERRAAAKHGEQIKSQVQEARQRLAEAGCGVPAVEARSRYGWIRHVTSDCVQRPDQRPVTWTDRIDRVLTHKIWGTLVFLAVMFLVFQSIFSWAAPLMDWIDGGVGYVADLIKENLGTGPLVSLLADGVVIGVGSVIIFLPQIMILFAFIALLEDCGYMARAAYLMDKIMSRAGLSGKSFIPMLSSIACAVPGIMATRVIENRRDRLATILVAPLMSCSARLPVYILLIGAFIPLRFLTDVTFSWGERTISLYLFNLQGVVMFCLYLLGIILAPLIAFALKRTLLRGETPVFVMEMPLYKWPSLRSVLRRMFDAGWAFLYRAGTIILASMIVVWALLYFPYHDAEGRPYPELISAEEERIAPLQDQLAELEAKIQPLQEESNAIDEQLNPRPSRGFLFIVVGLTEPERQELEQRKAALEAEIAPVEEEMEALEKAMEPLQAQRNRLEGAWKSHSFLGRMGHAVEPVVRPLGWDWKIGMAAIASFPAREVVIGTLGIIYNIGEADPGEIEEAANVADTRLGRAMIAATWDHQPNRPVFTVSVALSLMVFFALCCQCASTLAIIKRETGGWGWPVFTFVYMTVLAYVGALLVYQVGSWIG
ncbi:MAG: ferrous iron transport protein B [Gemmataceae bacterium]